MRVATAALALSMSAVAPALALDGKTIPFGAPNQGPAYYEASFSSRDPKAINLRCTGAAQEIEVHFASPEFSDLTGEIDWLRIGNRTIQISRQGSVGTGMPGSVFVGGDVLSFRKDSMGTNVPQYEIYFVYGGEPDRVSYRGKKSNLTCRR